MLSLMNIMLEIYVAVAKACHWKVVELICQGSMHAAEKKKPGGLGGQKEDLLLLLIFLPTEAELCCGGQGQPRGQLQ